MPAPVFVQTIWLVGRLINPLCKVLAFNVYLLSFVLLIFVYYVLFYCILVYFCRGEIVQCLGMLCLLSLTLMVFIIENATTLFLKKWNWRLFGVYVNSIYTGAKTLWNFILFTHALSGRDKCMKIHLLRVIFFQFYLISAGAFGYFHNIEDFQQRFSSKVSCKVLCITWVKVRFLPREF